VKGGRKRGKEKSEQWGVREWGTREKGKQIGGCKRRRVSERACERKKGERDIEKRVKGGRG
jgi:hypothetical protein